MERCKRMSSMNKNYTVYHLHSDLSNGVTNIDSVTKYKEYIEYAKSLGMTALAFAEHGNIFEWVHKKEAVEYAGMKYIHAAEIYLTADNNAKAILPAVDSATQEISAPVDQNLLETRNNIKNLFPDDEYRLYFS